MSKRYDQQYWQVYYQTGMCGGSFTCDAEAEAVALAQALTKARHFKGAAVVYYPADCETMFDALIVMEIGSEDVIPCRPHGVTVEVDSEHVYLIRNESIVATLSGAGGEHVGAGCAVYAHARFDSWFDHTGDGAEFYWFDGAPLTLRDAKAHVIKALGF